MRRRT
ncbi:UNVERIFIED_CONTAM: hypothetical protein GTU68_039310 [Idotea baltica]|jgi:hypothetical protein